MKEVHAYGPQRARIMLVGEAPGETEDKEGRPFVGSAGKLMREALMQSGIDPDDCYMTNICPFRPPKNKIREFFNEDGSPNSLIQYGMEKLELAIRTIKPNVIVAFGNYPLWALTDKSQWKVFKDRFGNSQTGYMGISDWRGSILECRLVPGVKVIPTYHPSYINQEGYSDHGTFLADLSRIAREQEFPDIRRPLKELIIDPRGQQRNDVFDRLMTPSLPDYVANHTGYENIITTDIEFIGNKLVCVGFTNNRDWATTIAVGGQSDIEFCRKVLETAGQPIAAQNAMFDCSVLEWHYNIKMFDKLMYDTMIAAHAINIELPKGLDYLVSIYTDQPYYKNMVDWKKVKAGLQPFSDVYDYNVIDVWTQHEIMEEQIKHDFLDKSDPRGGESAWKIFQFEMSLVGPLWQMSKRGIRMNTEKLKKLTEILNAEADGLQRILASVAKRRNFNVKSGQQVAELLHTDLGLPVLKKNKTGPATDDKTLAALVEKCSNDYQREVLDLIRDCRRRRDLLSKFAEVEMDEDGRCRGMYNPAGTGTGRLASKKFFPTGLGLQQQNIPRDKRARELFIPDPARLFGYADLERAESLVVAHLTGDPEMLRVHQPHMDAHKELAAVLFDKPIEDINGDERYLGKQTRHAGNYMEGPGTFQANVNKYTKETGVAISLADAKKFIGIYRELHPFLGQWWKGVEQQLWATRTLTTLIGRRRIFYGHIKAIIPTAVAFVPQGTVGDTLNIGLLNIEGIESFYMKELELWEQYKEWSEELRGYGYQSLLQVHDAVGFQVYERDADRALPLIGKLMSIPLTVPITLETFVIPTEVAVGPSWGEVKKWVEKRAGENGEEVKQLA